MPRLNPTHSDSTAAIKCPSDEMLESFHRDALNDATAATIRAHIARCARCQDALDILAIESDSLGASLRRSLEVEPNFADVSRRVDGIVERVRRDSAMGGEDSRCAARSDFVKGTKLTLETELELQEFHSRGGLGEVWTSTDEFGRTVALKVIRPDRVRDAEVRQRFLREARLTANLVHPGIVSVHAAGITAEGAPFYSMNLVEGETLEAAIRARRTGLTRLLRSFVEICHAVQYAHDEGVIHRDLKPSNVLLGKHGETVVIDWGLAKPINETLPTWTVAATHEPASAETQMTVHGSKMGTPEYMSPEQASDRTEVAIGPLSDVYSLGATLYAILTATAPFDGSDSREICEKVQRGQFLPPTQVNAKAPKALAAICMKAMSLAPEDRYGSVDLLREDIERWLDGQPVTAYDEPFSIKAGRWLKRHKTLASVFTAIVLVTTLALGIELSRARTANDQLQERIQQLAAAQQRIAGELYQKGDMPRSLEEFSAALTLRQQQYADDPTAARRFSLVEAWKGVALTQHKSAQTQLANDSYRITLEHLAPLLKDEPENVAYLTMKIGILGNRGMTDLVLHGSARAADTYAEALQVLDELIRVDGNSLQRKTELARLNGNLSDALQVSDDTQRELQHRRQAINFMHELIVDDGQDGLQEFLGIHAVRLTTTLLELEQEEDALRELRAITECCEQIESGEKHNWGQQFNAAVCLSLLSVDETDRYRSDALAYRAVTVLREMRKREFFRTQPQLVERLESESRLDPLRVRTDFIELLEAVRQDAP
jgi:serine/threonine protein kinase